MKYILKSLLVFTIILNVALRFRLVEIFSQYPIQAKAIGSDESGYLNLGLHLWEWLRYGNAVRLPLYPAFLSVFVQNGLSEAIIYIAQHLLFAGSAMAICFAIFTKWTWRLVAFNLTIYYGPFITHPNGTLSETFTASMMLFALTVFIRARCHLKMQRFGHLCGAFLFGLLSLCRPNFLLLFPFILVLLFITKQMSLRSLMPLFLVFVLPIAGWIWRNHAVQGFWIYNTTGGEAVYRGSRIAPAYCSDEIQYFNDILGTNRPKNLKISINEIWTANRYADNTNIYVPVTSNYPYKNDVLTHRNYMKLAQENYAFFILNRPDLLLYKVSNWLTQYMTASIETFEYVSYRNQGSYIHSRLIGVLYVLAVFYDVLFFPASLVALILCGIMIVRFPNKLPDYRLTVPLYATLLFSLLTPILSLVGGRFTMIQMLAVIVSCLYLIPACAAPWIRLGNKSDCV